DAAISATISSAVATITSVAAIFDGTATYSVDAISLSIAAICSRITISFTVATASSISGNREYSKYDAAISRVRIALWKKITIRKATLNQLSVVLILRVPHDLLQVGLL
ncbi:MAG: hypothetical protein JSS53_09495, partial [Proteobacteria bacterium]|nr:hypothetical protein [Pseudomonadota bacterium]